MADHLNSGNGIESTGHSPRTAVLIVDHGSRRAESNRMLEQAAARFAQLSEYSIVEPAHMELAVPSISDAFAACVSRGAERIVVFPWFLSTGRHWTEDIPALVQQAAEEYPNVTWVITPPFGMHPGLFTAIQDRIATTLQAETPRD